MSEQLLNLYEIQNLSDLRSDYRLVDIQGLVTTDSEALEQSLGLLAKLVAIAERAPTTIIRREGRPLLAVPAHIQLHELQYQLTPDIVQLAPRDEVCELKFPATSREERRVAQAFLMFELRAPLRQDKSLWSTTPNTFLSKRARNLGEAGRDIDVFDGFSFRLRELEQRLFVVISPTTKWVENGWLVDRHRPAELASLKMRRALYQLGHDWYVIQIVDAPACSIKDAQFAHRGTGEVHNVYDYTKTKCGKGAPPWVATLDPASPMIVYQYPGRDVRQFGAAALAKLMLGNQDPRGRAAQRASTRAPEERFRFTKQVAERFFQSATFGGATVRVMPHAHSRALRHFPLPALEFGQGKRVRFSNRGDGETIPIKDLGHTRLALLSDPEAGFAVSGAFDRQYLLVPATLKREIAEDFKARLEATVRQFCQSPYRLETLVFDDRQAVTLKAQVDSITSAIGQSHASGHGIFILPERAHEDLHNFLKRKLYKTVQVQCVCASKLRDFYVDAIGQGRATVRVRRDEEGKYRGYLTNTALGLMIVNRHWGWVLADPLHYEGYVSVDVLNHMACFVFLLGGGRRCVIRCEPTQQKEKLARAQIRSVVFETLRDLLKSDHPLGSLVMHRDGELFGREWEGFSDAVKELQRIGLARADIRTGAVEIVKRTAEDLRIASPVGDTLENPQVGTALLLDRGEGIICTTGWPFRLRGTARPLHVRIAKGELNIDHVLEDTFGLAQLALAAPDKPMRLPIGVKLCDDFLRSVAGDADEDSALYGEDLDEAAG